MVDQSIAPEDMQAKMTRLQAEMKNLQESVDDFSLNKDDLDAIEAGQMRSPHFQYQSK